MPHKMRRKVRENYDFLPRKKIDHPKNLKMKNLQTFGRGSENVIRFNF